MTLFIIGLHVACFAYYIHVQSVQTSASTFSTGMVSEYKYYSMHNFEYDNITWHGTGRHDEEDSFPIQHVECGEPAPPTTRSFLTQSLNSFLGKFILPMFSSGPDDRREDLNDAPMEIMYTWWCECFDPVVRVA